MPGRIEVYLHSDSFTPNKGGCIIRVNCQSDYAANTQTFIDFARKLVRLAYAHNAKDWNELLTVAPEIHAERMTVQAVLGEEICWDRMERLELDKP